MEHVDAKDLANHRQQGRNPYCTLDDSEAERVLYHIADAIDFIHSKDVVHNDIRPSNILYTKQRGPVLIDFGLSTDSKTVHAAGTSWYVPPEFPRHGTRGPAGDIFGFGVVMLFVMRKIPLPELLSPPLKWRIEHLRSKGPEAVEALETMRKWVRIVESSVCEIQRVVDSGDGGILEAMVVGMAETEVKQRLTGPQIRTALDEV